MNYKPYSNDLVNTANEIRNNRIDFNTLTILGGENDNARLLILESLSLFIQEQTRDLKNDFQSSPLMILILNCVSPVLHHNLLIFRCHAIT